MDFENDPIGLALQDFLNGKKPVYLEVNSDICEDDRIDVSYLFRDYEQMPDLEKCALTFCQGKILDVGAGAGCHASILNEKFPVFCIDTSKGAVDLLNKKGLKAERKTVFDLHDQTFDTILLLMNGIGISETIENLKTFLSRLKTMLNPDGRIICDSTDISYLYADEDGSFVINLNDKYYGEIQFNMTYKNQQTGFFNWLYIDFDNLSDIADQAGLYCTLLFEGENNHYLVSLEHKQI